MSNEIELVQRNKQSLIMKMADKYSLDGAKLLDTLKSTAFQQKSGVEVSNEQMVALMVVADQYGLNPFTKEIYAFPDKQNGIVPVVGVDGWTRIINSHPQFDGMEFTQSERTLELDDAKPCPEWIECIIYRKDRSRPIKVREYLDEVYREPFTKNKGAANEWKSQGPWQSHTKRFLRHKALIQCARLAFGFAGIHDLDEAQSIAEKDITPTPAQPNKAESIKTLLVAGENVVGGDNGE
jgi:phage recombination protein Bet